MAIYDIECHYTKCDVCGDGWDKIIVTTPTVEGEPWIVERQSNCFGHQLDEFSTVEDALAKMEDHKFLLATRYSKERYALVRKQVRDSRIPSRAEAQLREAVIEDDGPEPEPYTLLITDPEPGRPAHFETPPEHWITLINTSRLSEVAHAMGVSAEMAMASFDRFVQAVRDAEVVE